MERMTDVVENGDVDDRNQYDEQLLQMLRDRVRQLCANSFSEQAVVRYMRARLEIALLNRLKLYACI